MLHSEAYNRPLAVMPHNVAILSLNMQNIREPSMDPCGTLAIVDYKFSLEELYGTVDVGLLQIIFHQLGFIL